MKHSSLLSCETLCEKIQEKNLERLLTSPQQRGNSSLILRAVALLNSLYLYTNTNNLTAIKYKYKCRPLVSVGALHRQSTPDELKRMAHNTPREGLFVWSQVDLVCLLVQQSLKTDRKNSGISKTHLNFKLCWWETNKATYSWITTSTQPLVSCPYFRFVNLCSD